MEYMDLRIVVPDMDAWIEVLPIRRQQLVAVLVPNK